LWALSQGVEASQAPVLLFTDADIVHDPRHLSSLVAKLLQSRLELVSEMVRLNCASLAERALVPAFVYFFQMLYPSAESNDPSSSAAGAAGGTLLIRREALQRIGGIDAIKHCLIDDVALATAVEKIRPDLSRTFRPCRIHSPLPEFCDIWQMISRTAFTQLRYSPFLLALTLVALTVVWLVPQGNSVWTRPAACLWSGSFWVLRLRATLPTLARYGRNRLWALRTAVIALFYIAATCGSALNYWRGQGARWKSRAYGSN